MKIGLLFGSFNPIHKGHVAIAKFMAQQTNLDQVWLVVTPYNPLKEKKELAAAKSRLAAVKKAIGKNLKIKVSDVEFKLPLPSYTICTLEFLKKKIPQNEFVLIMGFDNLVSFHQWKHYKKILNHYEIYVYPRKVKISKTDRERIARYANVTFFNAPLLDISSTFIREQMKKGKM